LFVFAVHLTCRMVTFSFDGAAMPPVYVRPAYTGPEITPGEGEKVYNGSCHCGAITLKVRTKPLAEVEVKECDCTICTKVRSGDSYARLLITFAEFVHTRIP